jgi:hypothetical protein
MARVVHPPDVIPPRVENSIALKVVLTMLLLAIVTVCVLVYLVFVNQ